MFSRNAGRRLIYYRVFPKQLAWKTSEFMVIDIFYNVNEHVNPNGEAKFSV